MKETWQVDDFCQIEATVIMEYITCIGELDGDLSG